MAKRAKQKALQPYTGYCHISRLPMEVLVLVIRNIPLIEVSQMRAVNKHFANAIALCVVRFKEVEGNVECISDKNELLKYGSHIAAEHTEHLKINVAGDSKFTGAEKEKHGSRGLVQFLHHLKSLHLNPNVSSDGRTSSTVRRDNAMLAHKANTILSLTDNLVVLHLDLQWTGAVLDKIFHLVRLTKLKHLQLRQAMTAQEQLIGIVMRNSKALRKLDIFEWHVGKGSWVNALMFIARCCPKLFCNYSVCGQQNRLGRRHRDRFRYQENLQLFEEKYGDRFKKAEPDKYSFQERRGGVVDETE